MHGLCLQAERTIIMHGVLGVTGIKDRDECDCLELTWILPSNLCLVTGSLEYEQWQDIQDEFW